MTFIRSKIEHNLIIDIDEEYNKLMDNIDEPNIYILGNDILKGKAHIPVFSFIISYGDKFYHPNYICALLNDLFGIQSRPGCSCAPDYGQLLLKKRLEGFETFKKFIIEGNEIFRPGYTRLNLPYFYPKFIIEYIIKAIKFVCRHAQLFIGLYNYDIKSGKFFFYDTKKLPKITQISKMFNFENNENNNEIVKNSSLSENELSDNLSIYTFGNNNNKIKKEQLDNIFTKIENYCNSDLLFEDFNMFKNFVVEGNEIFKPGYTRLNLPYFYPKYVIEYIIKAIQFICQQAHLFIGLYNYDIKTGKFFYFNQEKSPKITKISNIFEDIQDEKKKIKEMNAYQ
jgi:hypothetical protein